MLSIVLNQIISPHYKSHYLFSIIRGKYESLSKTGQILQDIKQIKAVDIYDNLNKEIRSEHQNWRKYQNYLENQIRNLSNSQQLKQSQTTASNNFFKSFFGQSKSISVEAQNVQHDSSKPFIKKVPGFYCYGGPGSGKTFLMDLFYESTDIKEKERVHFNEFMLNIHKAQHKSTEKKDPLVRIALEKAQQCRLICLDEFQVTDIADALILKRLFENLINNNCILVATSNRPPDDLYKGGLQRHLFTPFIPFLTKECIVHNMDSINDYRYNNVFQLVNQNQQQRRQKLSTLQTYLTPNNNKNREELQKIFEFLTGQKKGISKSIEVLEGRKIQILDQAKGVAAFEFDEVCEQVMGASDYIAICRNFHTIILKNVPVISMQNRNAARRFILLIDEIYNHKVKLFLSAEKDLMNLFQVKTGGGESYDEEFALDRCRSRLNEMQSQEYLDLQSYIEEVSGKTEE